MTLQLKLLLLLTFANGTPVIARKIFGSRLDCTVDGGVRFLDGQPLFGRSKTVRGVVLSVVITALAAPLLGFPWTTGAAIAALAMLGDLISSFTKRRLKLPPSSMALGLDQIPESLLPLLVYRSRLGLGGWDITIVVAVFFIGELLLSRVLFRLNIRDRPY